MQIFDNFSLKNHNTFHLDVSCARFIEMTASDEAKEMQERGFFASPFLILGGGSNMLFRSDYPGTIIHPVFKGIELMDDDRHHQTLRVAAGEDWNTLQEYCLNHSLYGIENLVGIPGLAGSAPVQNIGAYGTEVKDSIIQVEGWDTDTGKPISFSNVQCQFGYRDSIFKRRLRGKCLITHVWFRLSKEERYTLTYKALAQELENRHISPSLRNIHECILHVRASKLPDLQTIGCAGSFFKNPAVPAEQAERLRTVIPDLVAYPADNGLRKLSAGQLIEKAGWKGFRKGDAGVYPLQALVIVNYGQASAHEICQLYEKIIADVDSKFGVTLQPEVNILP